MFGSARTLMNLNPRRLLPVVEALFRLVYPDRCQLCREEAASPAEGYVCGGCRRGLRWVSAPFCDHCGLPFTGALDHTFECSNCRDRNFAFTRARAVVEATGVGRELVHRYKYQRALWFEPFFAELLCNRALPELAGQDWSGVVPVPLHPLKRREREFNQATRLGTLLASALRVPVREDLVHRPAPTVTQTRLSRAERERNVRRAFAAVGKPDLGGTRWIVVDDVFTTGATTDGVARVLRRLGAAEVVVWTLARGV